MNYDELDEAEEVADLVRQKWPTYTETERDMIRDIVLAHRRDQRWLEAMGKKYLARYVAYDLMSTKWGGAR